MCSWVRWMRGGRTGLHLEKILHVESDFHTGCAGLSTVPFFSWELTGTESSSGPLLQLYKTLEILVF